MSSSITDERFWETRAQRYNSQEWATDRNYIDAILELGAFKPTDQVLDVGTGTGIVANAVSPFVAEVIGLDKSISMLKKNDWSGNKRFIHQDIRNPSFDEGVFDKVVARMVFHHIIERTQEAMDECFRVLKSGGLCIVAEGIPPDPSVKAEYIEIFRHKEERLTFMEEDLVALMTSSGFQNIRLRPLYQRQMSVWKWLEASGLPEEVQQHIFNIHINAGDHFYKAYNMVVSDGDCFIDCKSIIMVGEKP